MPRSPFASARVAMSGPAAVAAPAWSPGARTLRRARELQKATRLAVRKAKASIDPLSVRAVTGACRAVGRGVHWIMTTYPLVRSFLIAHAGGIVSPGEAETRKVACDMCPFGYRHNGADYCRGANNGRGCGCGHWRAARLGYKRKLAAFCCPQGRFGYSGLAVWLFRK